MHKLNYYISRCVQECNSIKTVPSYKRDNENTRRFKHRRMKLNNKHQSCDTAIHWLCIMYYENYNCITNEVLADDTNFALVHTHNT